MASAAGFPELSAGAIGAMREQLVEHDGDGRRAPVPFVPDHPELGDRALALPVATGTADSGAQAWLVAATAAGAPGPFERLILQQAVTVVALELMRQRTVRDTERRLAGDVLAEALGGHLDPSKLEARLAPFGVRSTAAVLVFSLPDPAAAELTLDRFLASAGRSGLVAQRGALLCAVLSIDDEEQALDLAHEARAALAAEYGPARAAVSRPA